jgi:hypothetical protein
MTRQELSDKYFHGCKIHGASNMGIVSLLSDVQHGCEDSREILNDVKRVLIQDIKDGAQCQQTNKQETTV